VPDGPEYAHKREESEDGHRNQATQLWLG